MTTTEHGVFDMAEKSVSSRQGFVYFIGGCAGPIKIGFATNVKSRLADLQVGSPVLLMILTFIPGGMSLEKEYHRRFSEYRMHGEWFERRTVIEHEILRLDPSALTRLDGWADAPGHDCDCEICQ